MEIISFEKRTFEEIAAKLDRFVQRVESLCREHGWKVCAVNTAERKQVNGWTTTRSAAGCVSVREPCKP